MTEKSPRYEVGPRWNKAERLHAAADIFEQLAGAILRGQLEVGSRMQPERALALRFGVSRIIVRQAIHKLAEVGLVKVRQGGTTIVLDPKLASNLQVLELEWRLGPATPADVYDFTERQIMQGHAILYIAQRRGTREQFEELTSIVEAYAAKGATAEELPAFEKRFWTKLAAACGNRLYEFETAWWFRLLAEHPRSHHPIVAEPHTRIAALRELVRRLRTGEDAAGMYLQMTDVLLSTVKPSPKRKPSHRSEP
jgi:DNA-binding FadR family transcriptional regulator